MKKFIKWYEILLNLKIDLETTYHIKFIDLLESNLIQLYFMSLDICCTRILRCDFFVNNIVINYMLCKMKFNLKFKCVKVFHQTDAIISCSELTKYMLQVWLYPWNLISCIYQIFTLKTAFSHRKKISQRCSMQSSIFDDGFPISVKIFMLFPPSLLFYENNFLCCS